LPGITVSCRVTPRCLTSTGSASAAPRAPGTRAAGRVKRSSWICAAGTQRAIRAARAASIIGSGPQMK
jgi:hypothetical protein